MNAERQRLAEAARGARKWKKWGPYLSERQWGTVREDYSPQGAAWDYFPHDMAPHRAYRWGEDGLAGLSDNQQRLCFALALWNGRDPILKERLFGLAGPEGNHGEDVKEQYFYLAATPTSSYLRMLYKYPQAEFPYEKLRAENRRRGRLEREYELVDTGVFAEGRYFDVFVTYAKAAPEDVLIEITIENRGPEAARLDVLPTLWFRNTWSWDLPAEGGGDTSRPSLADGEDGEIVASHPRLGTLRLHAEGAGERLFTNNDTNVPRLFDAPAPGPFKGAFHDYVVGGDATALAADRRGTKAAFRHTVVVPAGGASRLRLRLIGDGDVVHPAAPFAGFDDVLEARVRELEAFYDEVGHGVTDPEERRLLIQSSAGMLWSKQVYNFDIPRWLAGDSAQPAPPASRVHGRNGEWTHLNNADVISMPDKWEYPWYAAWDLAFHCLPLARLDPNFAKHQLLLLTREWYMHPNGQLPAYEWAFGDVNPPVHAWATWRVYQMEAEATGKGDRAFLERVFHKLLLNFTWWVNRKDAEGRNVFQGGFLGLDNIGVFDRSAELPTGGHLDQADGTSWMAMYSLNLLRISLELAKENPVYEDVATKFFEHFLYIAAALRNLGGQGADFWDDEDQFFYDVLHQPDGQLHRLRVRSLVGLTPLFAVEVLEPELLAQVPAFRGRLDWFLKYRPDLADLVSRWHQPGSGDRKLLSLLRGHRMKALLRRMLDENEFLSPYGVRALSRCHLEDPFVLDAGGREYSVSYQPAESETGLFGGNSNWRGPIWFPMNYLLIRSLRRFHRYYGDDFKVECPTGSGVFMTLAEVADELSRRLLAIFLPDRHGRRPVFGLYPELQSDPFFRDHLLFHEYFHGDHGFGLGASHQSGWTGLVGELLMELTARRQGATRVAEDVEVAAGEVGR